MALPLASTIAVRAGTLIRQDLAPAVVDDMIAAPLAMAGVVTPRTAAIAMSCSSILVVVGALRPT